MRPKGRSGRGVEGTWRKGRGGRDVAEGTWRKGRDGRGVMEEKWKGRVGRDVMDVTGTAADAGGCLHDEALVAPHRLPNRLPPRRRGPLARLPARKAAGEGRAPCAVRRGPEPVTRAREPDAGQCAAGCGPGLSRFLVLERRGTRRRLSTWKHA